ncbi:alpha/beta-hydrolase [Daldinia caldariorum]|uniref:alpha/beta-hydrolase n=1 Tax=Daldinia caldariorum TaxID=326644 RepID=UPI002008D9F2|nr:alpha/beta-hydrolase [Daldinia caldariorum]KAI1470940.1 alpha/beta-hydrolase [Daldinia caldariorum]
MRPFSFFGALVLCRGTVAAEGNPEVVDAKNNVTYRGFNRNGVEAFLNIPYGQDTSGPNRFKPPRPFVPESGSIIDALSYGPACPQPLGNELFPLGFTDTTEISEDCLNLNVIRPKSLCPEDRLPVLVWIYGGGFWSGQNREITNAPDGMILESVANGLPIIHVTMNYRLGFFGFAQSNALEVEGSENAGLRDQRLAIEWVRDNIEYFGGDPEKITIHGQSSGGLAVGIQIMAYGGSKPVPFQQGICESQALEPGIIANFTIDALQLVVDHVGCNTSALHSQETVACLRGLDMDTLLNASAATHQVDIAHNIGDVWLPVVDGDFLPAPPSQLIAEGRFANVTVMMGWCDNDLTVFTDTDISTPQDTRSFVKSYMSFVSDSDINELLSLYPSSDFPPNPAANLSSEFYRAARIFRDVLMVCEPVYYGAALSAKGNSVYLYDWNQTILDPILEFEGVPGLGPIHTSEFAYIFGNISHYKYGDFPFDPTPEDYSLVSRGSRSWSTFTSRGVPGLEGHDTFQGFTPSFSVGSQGNADGTFSVFVAGGPSEGLSATDGPNSKPEIAAQKLKERCAFINSDKIIKNLRF